MVVAEAGAGAAAAPAGGGVKYTNTPAHCAAAIAESAGYTTRPHRQITQSRNTHGGTCNLPANGQVPVLLVSSMLDPATGN
jgi:hypothetical protein